MADQFRLPIVHLVDNPGFMIGGEAERTGTIRYGVQAMNAIYRATVPLASVGVRRASGIARSEGHTSELQSLMRISYAFFCLKKNNKTLIHNTQKQTYLIQDK